MIRPDSNSLNNYELLFGIRDHVGRFIDALRDVMSFFVIDFNIFKTVPADTVQNTPRQFQQAQFETRNPANTVAACEYQNLRIVISKESELRRLSCSRMGAIRPRIPGRNKGTAQALYRLLNWQRVDYPPRVIILQLFKIMIEIIFLILMQWTLIKWI